MALTLGMGPFGQRPAGVFNFERKGPDHVLYFEASPKRVRVELGGRTVADSGRVKMLHETGHLPVYYFPPDDLDDALLDKSEHHTRCPFKGEASYWSVRAGDRFEENAVWSYLDPLPGAPPIAGYRAFYFEKMDAWYEEDERITGHPRDPYHRIDVRQSSRRVRVRVHGEIVAESRRPRLLFESSLRVRCYIPPGDVHPDACAASDTTSICPYKGTATYRSVRAGGELVKDACWIYEHPLPEVEAVAGYYCFYDEKDGVEVELEA